MVILRRITRNARVTNVTKPSPPICISNIITICPKRVHCVNVGATIKPVTQVADVAVNSAFIKPLDVPERLATGSDSNSAPAGCTGDAKTTAAFESGEVAYMLQNNLGTDGQVVWGQDNPGTSGSRPIFSTTRLWQVTFQSKDGTNTYKDLTKYIKNEGKINSLPTEVSGIAEGFALCGWNTEKNNGGESFNITTPITTNTTLYARVKETLVYTVSMDTYVIGNPLPTPTITPDPGNATVTFYYKSNSDLNIGEEWTEWNATNVSIYIETTYRMIAKVAETTEYAPYTTNETTFSALYAVANVTADGTTTGFLTFQEAMDAVKQANQGTLKLLQPCKSDDLITINNNMTLDLNKISLYADITISGGTVTLTGDGEIVKTLDISGGTVNLEGGTYKKIVVSTGNTANSLLAEGKAFRQEDDKKWIYADNTTTTLQNVSVKNVPIHTITASGGGIYSYGETINLTTAVTKPDGTTSIKAETNISEKAVENAVKNDKAITLPVRVPASKDSNSAATVGINLPKNTKSIKVEIPVENINLGTVIVLVHNDGREEIVKTTIQTENGVQFTVTEDVTVKIMDNSKNFTDTEKHWANKYIHAATARELFNGVSKTEFDANSSMTWEMFSFFLRAMRPVAK